ncbi:MAG: DUF255 domain-containing protein, partial [Planctomycetota bacterium]|nr:DUF255 domain-containing protein [Planctomycetota bacterium]
FVCIKVDREQRPDIDEIYMTATQLATQHGGWPNSVFLTPDLRPFFAGTYFGPQDQHGRPGFPSVLRGIHDAWTNRRDEVEKVAANFTASVRSVLADQLTAAGDAELSLSNVDAVIEGYARIYDAANGGFGTAPKFPADATLQLMLLAHDRTGDDRLLEIPANTIQCMAMGGIHDQVGGGFARYSVDAEWRVPHFEKMLYNQAGVVQSAAALFRKTGDESLRRVVRRTLDFVRREMTEPEGGFYSALDAETKATEGATYVWTEAQSRQALTSDESTFFLAVYGLAPVPQIPGHNHPDGGVVNWKQPPAETAARLGVDESALFDRLDRIHARLLAVRDERDQPMLDDKIIASWNGLMIEACAAAGIAFDEPGWIQQAIAAARFARDGLMTSDGRLARIWRRGSAEIDGFHEDYAFLARGFLTLHRATADPEPLHLAKRLLDRADAIFKAEDSAAYYFTPADERLIARTMSPADDALPSSNAVTAHCFLDLYEITGDETWRRRADALLNSFSGLMANSPGSQVTMLMALERRNRMEASAAAAPLRSSTSGKPVGRATESATVVEFEPFLSVSALSPGAEFQVALRMKIRDGWHINARDVAAREFIPTTIDLRSAGSAIEVLDIAYPDPRSLDAGFADDPLRVYEGSADVIISARLASPPEDLSRPVELRLVYTFQACSDSECLPPSTGAVVINVPIVEDPAAVEPRHDAVFSPAR